MSEESADLKFHIILPFCVESDFDVFLTVLKYSVARWKFDQNAYTCAFMSAMRGESFDAKSKDLTRHWGSMKSEKQQIRQMKLLGFWTIVNFPSLGKKLFGQSFKASPRNEVLIVENEEFTADKIDRIVFPKLHLRVIELTVNISTFSKLKDFVKVPVFVCAERKNEIRVSRKLISFEVDEKYVPNCWEALKTGVFTMDSYDEVIFGSCIILKIS